jgi:tetratricopeptide (TPR) repeat protein
MRPAALSSTSLHPESTRTARVVAVLGLTLLVAVPAACAHRSPPPPAGPARQLAGEAARIGQITYEDDFQEARLVLMALPADSPQRALLREKLLHYLLDPVLALKVEPLRREVRELDSDDVYDRVFESFRDALGLFDAGELRRLTPAEKALVAPAARFVVAVFSPRGADQQVTLAVAVLATLNEGTPEGREWDDRLAELVRWTDEAGSNSDAGLRRAPGAIDALEAALVDWPAPVVVQRLDALYTERQRRFAEALRKPVAGTAESARRALGDLLLAHGDEMQRSVLSFATMYLRSGTIAEASRRTAKLAGDAGDDPELRALLDAAARASATPADYLALARRFLPRVELLGGTSPDAADAVVAARVLDAGLARTPGDPELLVLSAHVARAVSSYFLAIRHLEEAAAVLEKAPGTAEAQARITAELMELYFLRLRLRLDPERDPPAFGEADVVRRQFAETRQRFKNTELKLRDADIDFEVGRSYVNTGQIDRAEPAFQRAREEGEPVAEITTELSNLALKRGEPTRAAQILRDGLDAMRAQASQGNQPDTIGSVEGRARLEKLLGDALDVSGARDDAEVAWRSSLIGWERLMIEHLRRKSFTASAEATVEVGRLLYLLGRHAEAIQKFDEAIEQDADRDQSYIDTVAFLVQNGETDAAVSVYRRGLARPSRAVSEYVKVYTSLWILDLTRRSNKAADPVAEAYLRTLDQRHGELRPRRGATWYHQLARFATGKMTYDEALATADTVGKRAEIYFYQAMRLLGDGKADDAQVLWKKVVDTRMFSFFEFDMASRYLRLGAPSTPTRDRTTATTETI